ncbi:MAG: methyl-accepting chemotaxis protein [Xanthomonadales bacterium]
MTTSNFKSLAPKSGGLYALVGLLVILLVYVALTFYLITKDSRNEQEWIRLSTDLQLRSQQLAKSASEAVEGSSSAFLDLSDSMEIISSAMTSLEDGNAAKSLPSLPGPLSAPMGELNKTWSRISKNAATILERETLMQELASADRATRNASSDILAMLGAANEIFLDSKDMFRLSRDIADGILTRTDSRVWPSLWSGSLGLIIILAAITLLVRSFLATERLRAIDAGMQNQKNQQAIMRLLDEMSSLADGDLTVQATVTDNITGAIADSINFAVEQLRELVTGINITAQTVAESAQGTMDITGKLAAASSQQAEQVREVTDTIKDMSESLDIMAERSRESSKVAQRSVAIANKGSDMVQQTIRGMDTIRDQIQQTSKRVKRLGESSQEIGDIVELINGIAEQTNILALNAAIQSASAGGAGRGFAVVADEVQRLAERATNATRRIEILVKNIQADTSEAVISMESTTSEVVSGARKAQDAGEALVQIEAVSKDLSRMIEEISAEAQAQSKTATQVAEQMTEIRDISIKTSEGTHQTARSMGQLADLVNKLSDSVADFKLPKQGS